MDVGSEKLLQEIKFDHLPEESITEHRWDLREGSEEDLLSHEDPVYGYILQIKAEQDLCLDYDLVGKLKQECKAVEFVVRSESKFSFHAIVRVRSRQQGKTPNEVRLRYDFNSDTEVRYPEPHPNYLNEDKVEYRVYAPVDQLKDGWTLMKIDLPKKVREIAAFEDKEWEFSELLTLRLKGEGVEIDVARIRLYSEYLNNVSTLPPGPIRNRWALLVGVNQYVDPAFPPLKFCVNDVLALERTLKALGYTVVVLHDDMPEERLLPTRDNVEAELTRLCQVAGPDDLLLVHFACHGKLVSGQPVLITRETRAPTLAKKALPLAEAERLMRESQVRRLVLTLDACHAGVEIGRDLADPEFIHNAYELAEGFALIAASTAQQVAQEWKKKEHGVFTYYLLEGLSSQADRAGKGFVTVDDLKTHVLDGLRRWNVEHGGLLQEPTARTEGLGDIILADYRDRARPVVQHPIHLGTEGPETSTSSSEERKLIEFTFTRPEPDDYRNWFSAFQRITEESRANGDWTDNNGAKHGFKHLEGFVEPFCNGQVYDASFSLYSYSKDPDGNFDEHVQVIVKVKPKRELSFEVTDQTQAHKREELAKRILQGIGRLKGVQLISIETLVETPFAPAPELLGRAQEQEDRAEEEPSAQQRTTMTEQAEYKYDVFISYSHADWAWVWNELLPRLEGTGLRVCIDGRDFEIGVPSLINMERAVDNSRHTLIVLTPDWIKSEWTEFESLLAGTADPAGRRRKLIPVMLKPCKLPSRIAMLTYADFMRPSEREAQMTRLVRSLGSATETLSHPEPSEQCSQAVTAPNPFGDTGRITDPARFFDREELLRQIFEELGKGVNVSLVGESRVGKSSLLSMVCKLGPERMGRPPEAFAYLSLAWVDDEDDFYAALCDKLGLPEPLRGYKLMRALADKSIILCLDHIKKMAWDSFTIYVHSQLRGLADGPAAPLRLVVASRLPLMHLFPDAPELASPLAGICHQVDVGSFPPDIARAFLAHRLRGTGVTFVESEVSALLAETGGHPAKLQRAAADLYRRKCNLPERSELSGR